MPIIVLPPTTPGVRDSPSHSSAEETEIWRREVRAGVGGSDQGLVPRSPGSSFSVSQLSPPRNEAHGLSGSRCPRQSAHLAPRGASVGHLREIAAGCACHPPADCGCGCHYGFGPRDQWSPVGVREEVKARGSELSPRGQQVTSRNLGSDSPAPCGERPGSHPLTLKGLTCPPWSRT